MLEIKWVEVPGYTSEYYNSDGVLGSVDYPPTLEPRIFGETSIDGLPVSIDCATEKERLKILKITAEVFFKNCPVEFLTEAIGKYGHWYTVN